jgi:xylan 1,4-beta-xylosidase
LGDRRLANSSPDAIVTKRGDGTLAIAVWNLIDPDQAPRTKRMRLTINGVQSDAAVGISRVDDEHSNTLAVYRSLGSPRYPTEQQVERMNAATALGRPAEQHLNGNHLDLSLQPNALLLVEVQSGS